MVKSTTIRLKIEEKRYGLKHDFYGIWNSRPFLRFYKAGKKRPGFFNSVKNFVLESCSAIFFTVILQAKQVLTIMDFQQKSRIWLSNQISQILLRHHFQSVLIIFGKAQFLA